MDRLLDLINRARAEFGRKPRTVGTYEQHMHLGYAYEEQFLFRTGQGYSEVDAHELALRNIEETIDSWYGLPVVAHPEIPLPKPIDPEPVHLSQLRVENGRLRDDIGYFHWNGVSDFYLPKYFGVNDQIVNGRLDYYNRVGRTGPRVFCSVNNNDGNYGFEPDRLDWVYNKCIERSLIPEFCLFAGRKQYSNADRKKITVEFCQWAKDKFILPQLVNEAQFNDFDSATDPALLDLSQVMASWLGHRNFSITDSLDADDENDVAEEKDIYVELAKHSNILVIHASRMKTGDPWRWINHLKGFADIVEEVKDRSNNGNLYGIHDEEMGYADTDANNRDNNPSHHIAANLVANCCGLGYTAHYIPEQNSNFPILEQMAIATQIKADSDFKFVNVGLGGSAVRRFSGFVKVRPCSNGHEAYAVGYGGDGSVDWDGYSDVGILFKSPDVKLYHAVR